MAGLLPEIEVVKAAVFVVTLVMFLLCVKNVVKKINAGETLESELSKMKVV